MDISIQFGGSTMSQHKNNKNLRHRKKIQPWPMILLVAGGLLLVIGAVFAFNKPSEPKAAVEVNGQDPQVHQSPLYRSAGGVLTPHTCHRFDGTQTR
jgi:cell division septal protein FtsQ